MPSKRSCFNSTLFRKNLSRFWPLWGGVSLVGSLAPLYMLLTLLSRRTDITAVDFTGMLYSGATVLVPTVSLLYAALCAMLVWGYLYSGRSVGLMHALPMDRTGLYLTTVASGLAMMLIPYVVVGGFLCLIALGWGFLPLGAVLQTAAWVVLESLTFFSLATVCAMATGNLFAMPAFYLLVNFLAPMLDALVTSFAGSFLLGVDAGSSGAVTFLSPIEQIMRSGSTERIMDETHHTVGYALYGTGVVAAYGLAGVVLLILGLLMYRARRSESAGDVVAFRWLRPVFRYGLALLSALTLGRLLYEIVWGSLFQRGVYADLAPMGVCMAITGVAGYYVASMLLEKSLRVFRRSWPGALTVCAGVALLCGCVSFDLLGVEGRIPDPEKIVRVSVQTEGTSVGLSAADDGALLERVRALHQAVLEDRDHIRQTDRSGGANGWTWLDLTYHLADGSQLHRGYRLPMDIDRAKQPDTYDGLLIALARDPEVQARQLELRAGYRLSTVYVTFLESGIPKPADGEENTRRLYEALLTDAREGNIPGFDPFAEENWDSYPLTVEAEGRRWITQDAEGSGAICSRGEEVYASMTNTVAELLRQELVTVEELEGWAESRGFQAVIPAV